MLEAVIHKTTNTYEVGTINEVLHKLGLPAVNERTHWLKIELTEGFQRPQKVYITITEEQKSQESIDRWDKEHG